MSGGTASYPAVVRNSPIVFDHEVPGIPANRSPIHSAGDPGLKAIIGLVIRITDLPEVSFKGNAFLEDFLLRLSDDLMNCHGPGICLKFR